MAKETMKQTITGYIYRGVPIYKNTRRIARSWEVSWVVEDKKFLLLRDARKYIDQMMSDK